MSENVSFRADVAEIRELLQAAKILKDFYDPAGFLPSETASGVKVENSTGRCKPLIELGTAYIHLSPVNKDVSASVDEDSRHCGCSISTSESTERAPDKEIGALAECLLDYFAVRCAGLGVPTQMEINDRLTSSDKEDTPFTVESVDMSLVRSYLLHEETTFERELTERGHVFDNPFAYSLIALPGDDGQVIRVESAVVLDLKDASVMVQLETPVIFRLILGDSESSLADQVSLAAYFVRLCCDAVSRIGLDVSVCGEVLTLFRDLVRRAGLPYSHSPEYGANNSGDPAE